MVGARVDGGYVQVYRWVGRWWVMDGGCVGGGWVNGWVGEWKGKWTGRTG